MESKTRLPKENEILGINIVRVRTGTSALIYCFDRVLRNCRLRVRHGDLFLRENDLILIEKEHKNGSILHKYSDEEIKSLKEKGLLKDLKTILEKAEAEKKSRFEPGFLEESAKTKIDIAKIIQNEA